MNARWTLLALLATVTMCSADEQSSFRVESKDVTSVKIAFSRNYPPLLEIHLRRGKAMELTTFTTTNQFKTVAILIENEKISEPRIMEPVTNGVLEVRVPDPERAVRLATDLMKNEQAPPTQASQAIGAGTPQPER